VLTEQQLNTITKIRLPAKKCTEKIGPSFLITVLERNKAIFDAKVELFRCRANSAHRFKVTLEDNKQIVIETKPTKNDYENISEIWRCDSLEVEGDCLVLVNPIDKSIKPKAALAQHSAEEVYISWAAGIKYKKEKTDKQGEIIEKGFREPQYGALHALANYWSAKTSPATIVLPTGTGKTDVMIAAIIANQCDRTLVVVPTDALRSQTISKLESYGILHSIDVIDSNMKHPIIGCISGQPTEEILGEIERCNIVVTTIASITKASSDVKNCLASLFSHVFFDEAHHRRARTWDEFSKYCNSSRLLLMTATPFREDGKQIGGKFIYTFPLHKAQEQGYFRPIKFSEVFEPDENNADRAIANEAVRCLRKDLADGKKHLLMARTGKISDAQRLYDEIYSIEHSDLNPIVIHSRTPKKAEKLESIKSGIHKIIICVEMLGEGFDLPYLKVAALHSLHKSIGITLQFIGRFTRSLNNEVGDATFVVNLAEDGIPDKLEELYQENADWNDVVSDLSFDSISPEEKLSHLVDNLEIIYRDEDVDFTPYSLLPKIGARVYYCDQFTPQNFKAYFDRNNVVVFAWLEKTNNTLIVITKQNSGLEWSDTRDIKELTWDLHLFYFNHKLGLLFTNTSKKKEVPKKLLDRISGIRSLIREEQVFRAFSGLHRLTLFNIGLTGHNKNVRYQMYAGIDVKDAITPLEEGNKLKCNVSGVGYEQGTRKNIGCSRKGKVWSMTPGSVAQWKEWCDHIGEKLTNNEISDRDFLKYTLTPQTITKLPAPEEAIGILADWPDNLFQSQVFSFNLDCEGHIYSYDVCELNLDKWSPEENSFLFSIHAENISRATFRVSLVFDKQEGNTYKVEQTTPGKINVRTQTNNINISDYFQNNPPLIRLSDGSQLSGDILLKQNEELKDTYNRDHITVLNWKKTDITKESRWKNNIVREDSIQHTFMQSLEEQDHITFVIDDDDSGESADIVAIEETEEKITVYLWHCKYSSGETPGNRVKDLYEVCGQAQKSAKWTWSFDRLVRHLKHREYSSNGGRQTRFAKGNYHDLHTLRKASKRKEIQFKIGIVQPGLLKENISAEHLTILGATNSFVSCITNHRLLVISS